MGNISSIDDLLLGTGNTQQPTTPEHKVKTEEKAPIEEIEPEVPAYSEEEEVAEEASGNNEDAPEQADDDHDGDVNKKTEKADAEEDDLDEYGNPKERIPPGMKERLDRKEKQHQREIEQREIELQQLRQQLANQGASTQVQKAAADFEYNPNDEASWQQQLQEFVKHTVKNMNNEEQQKQRQVQEQQAEREFAQKFTQGMGRFSDFREVVSKQPIDDAMTMALRGMDDPSAFIYAASKRNPQELERISKIKDPYARVVEMGKLEERMRRNRPTTKAPRPLGRTREDVNSKPATKQPKEVTGDDLIANANKKRAAALNQRLKSNR